MSNINPWLEIGRLIAAAVFGAFAAHFFTAWREKAGGKAARRREFLSFMRRWKVQFKRKYLEAGGWVRDKQAFVDNLPEFVALAEGLRGDISRQNRERFEALIKSIANREANDFYDGKRYSDFENAIDGITALVENN